MIRVRLLVVLAVGCALAISDGGFAQSSVDITGTWTGTWQSSEGGAGRFEVRFVQAGQKLSGSIRVTGSIDIRNGTVDGMIQESRAAFGAISGGTTLITFTGIFTARTGSGEYRTGRGDEGTWSAVR